MKLELGLEMEHPVKVGLNSGAIQEFDSCQGYNLIREKECHSKGIMQTIDSKRMIFYLDKLFHFLTITGVKAIQSLNEKIIISGSYDQTIKVREIPIPNFFMMVIC